MFIDRETRKFGAVRWGGNDLDVYIEISFRPSERQVAGHTRFYRYLTPTE